MTDTNRPDMQDWEAQINDLLDGELSDIEAQRLKGAAEQDRALASAIIEAYQLQQALAAIPMERAPDSLSRKLRRIPRERSQRSRSPWFQPRWVTAFAAVPLAILLVFALRGPQEPSAAEIAQAEQDFKVALAYLGKVSRRTGIEIETQVSHGVNEAVTQNLLKTIDEQMNYQKEQKA